MTVQDKLLNNSISAALSSIELYNKPDFKYREEIFTILIVNAWELLLKAKILKENNDNLESLYLSLPDGTYKRNRTKNFMTIEIIGAIEKLSLNKAVRENIEKLIEIRDSAIHFYNNTTLSYIVFILGSASLRNYSKILIDWFDKSLLDYNFYIMPLGFSYSFQTLRLIDLQKEPEVISNLAKSIDKYNLDPQDNGFNFVCEIKTVVQSSKKMLYDTDLVTTVDNDFESDNIQVILKTQNLIDLYPYSYKSMITRIKKEFPMVLTTELDKIIKQFDLKNNTDYSCYNFRNKDQQIKYFEKKDLPQGTPSIYNDNAIQFIMSKLKK